MTKKKFRNGGKWLAVLGMVAFFGGLILYPASSTQACGGWGYGGRGHSIVAPYSWASFPSYQGRRNSSHGKVNHPIGGPRSGGRHG